MYGEYIDLYDGKRMWGGVSTVVFLITGWKVKCQRTDVKVVVVVFFLGVRSRGERES